MGPSWKEIKGKPKPLFPSGGSEEESPEDCPEVVLTAFERAIEYIRQKMTPVTPTPSLPTTVALFPSWLTP